MSKTTYLTFSPEEQTALILAAAKASPVARWTIEGRDGDAWAALEDDLGEGLELVGTIQLTSETGRRFVALAPNGRDEIGAGDDLDALLPALLDQATAQA